MEENLATYHKPVLIQEVLEGLYASTKTTQVTSGETVSGKLFIDVTFGGGGHTRALLDADPTTQVIAFDWDIAAVERGQQLVEQYAGRLQLYWGNFAHLYKLLKKYTIPTVDGVLADFGTSQFQIHTTQGLSFFGDTPLDMRLSPAHFQKTAADYVNYATAHELEQIFWNFGNELRARPVVALIIQERKKTLFKTTGQLVKVIEEVIPRRGPIHPATKIFQALRIVVNKELDNISAFLPAAFQFLKPGGRLACISFHSLEDRLVKEFYRTLQSSGQAVIYKPACITATEQELAKNISSRSAKLRFLEKL